MLVRQITNGIQICLGDLQMLRDPIIDCRGYGDGEVSVVIVVYNANRDPAGT